MKYKLLILALPLLAIGCASPRGAHPLAREVIRPGTEPECFTISDDDAAMAKAVKQARKSVHTFTAALQHPKSGQRKFEVKKPFVKDGVVEHMWLSDVTYSGGRFHGVVDNHPRKIPGVKMGDRVSVNPNEITDWAFVDKGNLVGGYTIRLLFSDLSPERKLAFEKEAEFHISTP